MTRSSELMIDIEPEPSAHKENEVNSTIDFGLDDGHKEVGTQTNYMCGVF